MPKSEKYSLLIVDNDEIVINNLRRLLKNYGIIKIKTALNIRQALQLIKDSKDAFSLIICALDIPGVSGIDFFEKSKELAPDARRIIISGHADSFFAIGAINRGSIHQYVIKPLNWEDFYTKVKTELTVFEKIQEKKRLDTLTNYQNNNLFKLAKSLQAKEAAFKQTILVKQEEINLLKSALSEIQSDFDSDEASFGLESFLSKIIVINSDTLEKVFPIIKNEIVTIFEKICKTSSFILFSEGNKKDFALNPDVFVNSPDSYELIDLIIEFTCRKSESSLYQTSSNRVQTVFDEYHEVPDIGELACNESFISKEDLLDVQQEYEKSQASDTPRTIDRIFLDLDKISRKNLSLLMVKKGFIDIRLKDREFAKKLLERDAVSEEKIEKAFIKQLNRFDEGGNLLLGDILVENDLISKQTMDEIMEEQNRKNLIKYQDFPEKESSEEIEILFDLQISEDKTEAAIIVPQKGIDIKNIESIKDLLKKYEIQYGIIEDTLLKKFLSYSKTPGKKFIVAMGRKPVPGIDARIIYHFNTASQLAGSISKDGTIDFRNRGDIPFIKAGALLAEKIPLEKSKYGRDVFGNVIKGNEVNDLDLKAGNEVVLSKDNLKLHANIKGKPQFDATEQVSIYPDYEIKGDVSFQTGHINFAGNVFVSGIIKEGFHVNCVDLTVTEIHGAVIDISGNLNVSTGIINSQVNSQGYIQAKFINNSKIYAFRNIMVTREIMGSYIAVNGECINTTGKITDSVIVAKKGLDIGQVGTDRSAACVLKAGIDEYSKRYIDKFDIRIKTIQHKINLLKNKKNEFENKNLIFHKEVTDLSFTQDSLQEEMDLLNQQLLSLKNNKDELIHNRKRAKTVEQEIASLENQIKEIFVSQNKLMKNIVQCDTKTNAGLGKLQDSLSGKEAILEILKTDKVIPRVKAAKRIMAGTKIFGPETSMVVKNDLSHCKIMEIESSDPDDPEKRMVIQNY